MRMLGVSRAQLRRLEERGDVRPIRVGESKHRWYDVAELEQFFAERVANRQPHVPTTVKAAATYATASDPLPASSSATPQPGTLTISAEELRDLRSALGSKISTAAGLVARVRALASDYGALDEELRQTENELADRVVELAEARTF
ncbi:MAG: MerR family transcriptional regulator [Gemmatimonadaceae bacterium]|nr:MerR family transcriptional regulator [Gemmatimonadaceae bacterium]